jgi:hypothetical protein
MVTMSLRIMLVEFRHRLDQLQGAPLVVLVQNGDLLGYASTDLFGVGVWHQ